MTTKNVSVPTAPTAPIGLNRGTNPLPTIAEKVPEHDIDNVTATTVFATLVTIDEDTPVDANANANANIIDMAGSSDTVIHSPPPQVEVVQNSETYEEMYDRLDARSRCLLHGCICTYVALDFNCHTVGCSHTNDCLCFRHNTCCAYDHKRYPLGVSVAKECHDPNGLLNFGCICCECGLILPTTLCASTHQFFCIQSVGSVPFHPNYVPHPILAYHGLSCCPTCDCCIAPPPCPAITALRQSSPPLWSRNSRDRQYRAFHMIPSNINDRTYESPMYRD